MRQRRIRHRRATAHVYEARRGALGRYCATKSPNHTSGETVVHHLESTIYSTAVQLNRFVRFRYRQRCSVFCVVCRVRELKERGGLKEVEGPV